MSQPHDSVPEPCTVLVVDDEPLVRLTIRHHLAAAGYRVLEAGCAAEARRLFAGAVGVPDLVLADIGLPDGSGPDLVVALRAGAPALGALYMSAYPEELLVSKGRLAAGAPLLRKPFSAEALLAKVAEVIACAEPAPGRRGPR